MAFVMCPQIKMPSNEIFCSQRGHYLPHADILVQPASVMSKCNISSATLLQIEEQLEEEDQDTILFACRDITSQTNIRELLGELNERFKHGIVEALWLVKRFDLLKKYLKLTKTEAEQLIMKQTRIISDYSYLLADINGHLEEDDLQSLVFILKDYLRNAGKIKKSFLCLANDLEKNKHISPEDLHLLEQSFQTIHRVDLRNKIHKFQQKGNTDKSSHYINAFAAASAIPRNQVSSSSKPVYIRNGHKESIPVQETSSSIQPVQLKYATASKDPPLKAEASDDDRYAVRQNPIGFCLIIDCVGNDSETLGCLFRGLKFDVDIERYAGIQDVKKKLQDVAHMEQLKRYDIFICVLISRGNADSLFFIDGCSPGLPLENIRNYFTGQSCPNLIGKPKLFLIQNYITDDREVQHDGDFLEEDGPSNREPSQERRQNYINTPNEADIFWSHCKTSERHLQRLSGSPSLYLKTFTDLLSIKQRRKHQDIQEIHTEINRILYSKKSGCSVLLQHTLTKKLFIHPA